LGEGITDGLGDTVGVTVAPGEGVGVDVTIFESKRKSILPPQLILEGPDAVGVY
jgi:hypothetical protein